MIYLLISIVLLYFVHRCFGITNLYNPFVVFFLYHTFFLFFALSYQSRYPHVEIAVSTIWLIVSSYITCVCGALVATYLLNKAGLEYIPVKKIKFEGGHTPYSRQAGYIILFIGFLLAIKFIVDTGGLLFFKENMETARIDDRKGRGLLTLFTITFITFGTLISVFDHKSVKFKVLILLISSFFLLCFGNRSIMLELDLMFFIHLMIYKQKKIKIKYLAYMGTLIFVLLVLFGAIRTHSQYSVYDLFMAQFGWRPFVNIQNVQWIIDYIPEKLDYLYGGSMLIELKLFLPGSNPNFGSWLKDAMHLVYEGGSITTSHLGIAYANFGYAGALLFPVFIGFTFQSFYMLMIRRETNSKLRLVVMLSLSVALGGVLSSGLLTILIMSVMFICFVGFCYIAIIYFLRFISYLAKNNISDIEQNQT